MSGASALDSDLEGNPEWPPPPVSLCHGRSIPVLPHDWSWTGPATCSVRHMWGKRGNDTPSPWGGFSHGVHSPLNGGGTNEATGMGHGEPVPLPVPPAVTAAA